MRRRMRSVSVCPAVETAISILTDIPVPSKNCFVFLRRRAEEERGRKKERKSRTSQLVTEERGTDRRVEFTMCVG